MEAELEAGVAEAIQAAETDVSRAQAKEREANALPLGDMYDVTVLRELPLDQPAPENSLSTPSTCGHEDDGMGDDGAGRRPAARAERAGKGPRVTIAMTTRTRPQHRPEPPAAALAPPNT